MPNTLCTLKEDAARLVLKGLAAQGVEVVKSARSPHASDCSCDEKHVHGPMGQCRCIRAMRLRARAGGDWLLVFGDKQEGGQFRLLGPYTAETPLSYGGGFWEKVEV